MFGSTVFTTGATSFATNGTFSPNLKSAGISAGITALFAGIEGGVQAIENNGNFWTGKPIAIGRSPFSLNNTDRFDALSYGNHDGSNQKYETLENYKYFSDPTKHASHENLWYGKNGFNGNASRWRNYVSVKNNSGGMPTQRCIALDKFKGPSIVSYSGHVPEGVTVTYSVDGEIVKIFSPGSYSGLLRISAGSSTLSINVYGTPIYINTVFPFKSIIQGYINYPGAAFITEPILLYY